MAIVQESVHQTVNWFRKPRMRQGLDRYVAGWRGPLLAALVALLAGLPGLLLLPPLDRDESRFAQASVQMLESGNYVDIRFQDEPRWKKPIGIYWLQALAVSAVSEPSARDIRPYRLPSLIGAMLAAWAVAWMGARMFGARAGFVAGAMLGACFVLSMEAGMAKTDAMLCGLTALSMAALARLYLPDDSGERRNRLHALLFWGSMGLSILIKGPIGPMVIVLAIVGLSLWDRNLRWLGRLDWGWGLLLLAALVLPWGIAITIATDGGFWREAIGVDFVPKLMGAQESHGAPPGTHVLLTPILLFPVALLLPAGLVAAWRRRREPAIRFAICWLVPAWIVFELTPTKLVHYTLPMYGALALLMAAALTAPLGRAVRWTGAILGLLSAAPVAAVAIYGQVMFGSGASLWWTIATVVGAALAAAVGGLMLVRQSGVVAILWAMAFGIAAHAGLSGTVSQMRPLLLSPQLVATLEAADLAPTPDGQRGPVAITRFHEPSFVFLTGTDTELTDAEGAARAVADGRPAFVEAADEAAFQARLTELGLAARPAGEVRGKNYSNGRDLTLTLYAPAGAAPAAP